MKNVNEVIDNMVKQYERTGSATMKVDVSISDEVAEKLIEQGFDAVVFMHTHQNNIVNI